MYSLRKYVLNLKGDNDDDDDDDDNNNHVLIFPTVRTKISACESYVTITRVAPTYLYTHHTCYANIKLSVGWALSLVGKLHELATETN
jgi:hypothetical protein